MQLFYRICTPIRRLQNWLRLPPLLQHTVAYRPIHLLLLWQSMWSVMSGMTNYHFGRTAKTTDEMTERWHRRYTVIAVPAKRRDVSCFCCCLCCLFIFPSSFHLIRLHHVIDISICSFLPYDRDLGS